MELPRCGEGPIPAKMLAVPEHQAKQEFTRADVQRMLKITSRQLAAWERQGFIPTRQRYALNDLLALKTLGRLRENRVPPRQIRQAVSALRRSLRGIHDPLTQLRVYSEGARIRVDIDGRSMEAVSGQLLLNFGPEEITRLLAFPGAQPARNKEAVESARRVQAEALFEKGLAMERGGEPVERVVAAYEEVLELDPQSTGALVNLGTIFFNGGSLAKAESYYLRAIEADPSYPLARFNLGNLYDEQGKRAKALEQYLLAIRENPKYADAHYNLALLYQSSGEVMKAVLHWRSYLKIDPNSSWAAIARRELNKLKDSAVIKGGGG